MHANTLLCPHTHTQLLPELPLRRDSQGQRASAIWGALLTLTVAHILEAEKSHTLFQIIPINPFLALSELEISEMSHSE